MTYSAGTAFIKVGPSLKGFETEVSTYLKTHLKPFAVQIIADPDVTEARAHLDALTRARSTTLNVNVDDAAARTKLDFLSRPRSTTLNVDADTGAATSKLAALGALSSSVSGLGVLGGLGGVLAAPVGASAIGGGAALGSALTGAVGAGGALAASVIGNIKAISALDAAQKTATSSATSLASAQNGVASAMASLQSAQFGVTSAEQSLTTAQQNAKSAQDALNQARQTARDQLQGLEDTLKGAALAESGSKLNLAQAELNLRQLERSGTATRLQVEQAVQAVKEAKLAADQAADNNKKTQRDAEAARKAGVAGNAQVVSAQQQLVQAKQGVTRAEQQLAQAQVQVATAQRQVAVAQQSAATAATANVKAQDALAKASAAVSPKSALAFKAALAGVSVEWGKFLRLTSGPSIRLVDKVLGVVSKLLPGLAPVANAAAQAVSGLVTQFGNFVSGPGGQKFLRFLTSFGSVFISQFGKIGLNVMKGLLHVFEAFAPLSKSIGGGLVSASAGFAKMTAHLGKSSGFQAFIAYVKDNGPKVLSVLGNLAKFIGRFFIALAPVGGQLLTGLAKLMALLANAPAPVILALGVALVALVSPIAAIILGAAALATIFENLYATSSSFREAVDQIGAQFQQFGPQLKTLIGPLQDDFTSFVNLATIIWKRFGSDLISFAKTYLHGIILEVRGGLKIISGIFQLFADVLSGNWSGLWGDLGTIVSGAWDVIHGFALAGWAGVKLLFTVQGKILAGIWGGIWDGLQKVASVTWETIKSLVSAGWDDVKTVSAGAINLLIGVLNKLVDGINFFTKFVGIPEIKHIPYVSGGASSNPGSGQDFSHTPGGGFAQGGVFGSVLPGYTPGRDVHHFVSATGGYLDLSGGEGILIPQATRLLGGKAGIDSINAKARAFAAGGVFRPIGSDAPITQGLHDVYTGFPAIDFGHLPGAPIASVAPGRVSKSEDLIAGGRFVSYGRVMQVLHAGFESLYAHLSKRGYGVGTTVGGGQIIGLSGNVGNVIGSGHLHFGVKGRSPYDFVSGSTAYTSGSGSDVLAHFGHQGIGLPGLPSIPNPLDYLKSKVTGALSGIGSAFDTPLGQMLKGIPMHLVGLAADKLKGLLGGTLTNLVNPIGPVNGAEQAQAWARSNLPSYGWGPEQFQPLLQLWNGESGWNYLAENQSSGAYGIPQALPPEKMATIAADWRTNPITQMRWGLGYIRDAYGSPASAFSQWSARSPHWYDQGGAVDGVGYFPKLTPRREWMLNPDESQALQYGLRNLTRAPTAGAGGPAEFNLYDKDNVLIGTIRGEARNQVLQHAVSIDELAEMNT